MRDGKNGADDLEALKGRATQRTREATLAAEERLREIRKKARELGSKAGETAERRLGGQRERIAGRIEQTASGFLQRAEGGTRFQHQAQRRLAHGMESAAGYLQRRPTGGAAGEFRGMVQRHPMRALVITAVVVFLISRMLR